MLVEEFMILALWWWCLKPNKLSTDFPNFLDIFRGIEVHMNLVQAFHLHTDCTLAITCILHTSGGSNPFSESLLRKASRSVISRHAIAGCVIDRGAQRAYSLKQDAVSEWDGKTLSVNEKLTLVQWCDRTAWSEAVHGVDVARGMARFVVSSPQCSTESDAPRTQQAVGLVLLVHHVATDARGLVQLLHDLVLSAVHPQGLKRGVEAGGAHPLVDWMPMFKAALDAKPPTGHQALPPGSAAFPRVLPPCRALPHPQPGETQGGAQATATTAAAASSAGGDLCPEETHPRVCPHLLSQWSKAVPQPSVTPPEGPLVCEIVPPFVKNPLSTSESGCQHSGPAASSLQPLKPDVTLHTVRLRLSKAQTAQVLSAAKAAGVGVWAWIQAATTIVEASIAAGLQQRTSAQVQAPLVWPVRARTFVDARGLLNPPLPPSMVAPVTGVASLETMAVTPSTQVSDLALKLQAGIEAAVQTLDVLRTVQTRLFGGPASIAVNNYGVMSLLEQLPDTAAVRLSHVWVTRQERTEQAAHEQFNVVAYSLHGQLHLSIAFMPQLWHPPCVEHFLRMVVQTLLAVDCTTS